MSTRLLEETRRLLVSAEDVFAGSDAGERLRTLADRLDEPLRVAIAGKVKAGKSTLLNALVGEELAPTDAGECTQVVTWYDDGVAYRVVARPHDGPPRQLPFTRAEGGLAVDLGGFAAGDLDRLEVEWPSAALRELTLIDTPGVASLSVDASARTHEFLVPDDEPTAADAVLYLMRHLHATDVRFLESFHDDAAARATPINAVAVLSRADEVGAGRLDALVSARRIAKRYRADPVLGRLCQTVVPVAGLLAQAGATLREDEFKALSVLASADRGATEELLLSTDRFGRLDTDIPLEESTRARLLERLGLFGVRLGVSLVRRQAADTAPALASLLLARSGIAELRQVLETHFAARRDALKARSALLALDSALRTRQGPEAQRLAQEVERVHSGAHEFAELRLLAALRSGIVDLAEDEQADAERLLGAQGTSVSARLGLPGDADETQVHQTLIEAVGKWRRRAEHPMASKAVRDAAQVIARTGEGLLVAHGSGNA